MQARDEELITYPVRRYVAGKGAFEDAQKFTSKEVYLDITLNGTFLTTGGYSRADGQDTHGGRHHAPRHRRGDAEG